MKIPKSLFSGRALVRMGFRPRAKPKRAFDFKGPTAKADALAFDQEMMEWLRGRAAAAAAGALVGATGAPKMYARDLEGGARPHRRRISAADAVKK